MLIVALALAVIGLAALVAAVVTSNEFLAWVCIAASGLGVLLLIVDAIKERQTKRAALLAGAETAVIAADDVAADVVDEEVAAAEVAAAEVTAVEVAAAEVTDAEATAEITDAELAADISAEEHPEEVVHDEPDFDTPGDDEPEFPEAAEASAIHIVTEEDLSAEEISDAEGLDDVEEIVEESIGETAEENTAENTAEENTGETAEPGER